MINEEFVLIVGSERVYEELSSSQSKSNESKGNSEYKSNENESKDNDDESRTHDHITNSNESGNRSNEPTINSNANTNECRFTKHGSIHECTLSSSTELFLSYFQQFT